MRRLAALLLLAPLQDPLPDRLKAEWKEQVAALKDSCFYPASRYDDLVKKIDADSPASLVKAMIQLGYDHESEALVVGVVAELKAIGAAMPETVELEQLTLKNGRVLVGMGGPLSRHYRMVPADSLLGQRTLEPNLGMPGRGNFWIAASDIVKHERAKIAPPKAFLVSAASEKLDDAGRLHVTGDWLRPGKAAVRETVVLDAVEVTNGGTLFASKELGVRTVRLTHEFPALAKDHAGEWTVAKPAPAAALPESLRKTIADLRAKAPDVEWPEPFTPDTERAALAAKRTDLVDADAAASLLRIRFALTYGSDLPELALKDPRAMLAFEKRVRACLDGGAIEPLLKEDWRLVAAAVRHGMTVAEPPALDHVRFPKGHSPWRPSPLLVVLHGQYCDPSYDFKVWGDLADAAGMVLVCPKYGSPNGSKRDQETDEEVLGVVRRLALRGDIDPDRIYLTGISMGGATTWSLSTGYPGRWAAGAPEIHGPNMHESKPILLRNLRTLPFYIFEGEFDGLNTVFSRSAVEELKKAGAPVEYRESKLFGHDRMVWRYPAVLDWFSKQRRDSHPATIEHEALNAHKGARAWISMRSVSNSVAFGRKDGGFAMRDLAAVKGAVDGDVIAIEKVAGKPAEVEVFFDDRLMKAEMTVKAGGKRIEWKVKPSVKRMLERVLATGDREQVYADSILVKP